MGPLLRWRKRKEEETLPRTPSSPLRSSGSAPSCAAVKTLHVLTAGRLLVRREGVERRGKDNEEGGQGGEGEEKGREGKDVNGH